MLLPSEPLITLPKPEYLTFAPTKQDALTVGRHTQPWPISIFRRAMLDDSRTFPERPKEKASQNKTPGVLAAYTAE